MYRELLLGCGAKRIKEPRMPTAIELDKLSRGEKLLEPSREGVAFQNLVTLDINPQHQPDIVFDLSKLGTSRILGDSMEEHAKGAPLRWWMPCFKCGHKPSRHHCDYCNGHSRCRDNLYDEIHAYEVLEHIGQQGDYNTFFAQFTELHRILKPNSYVFATCPAWHSMWAWGDPSHSRIINAGTLAFLSQAEYEKQVGVTPMSDFRYLYRADFRTVMAEETADTFLFILQAIK